ncbi:hypothetical protein [Microvirga sp. TS319]|uniref:hypothetical protein n=1 Tax=Microvirga sp. TS319 TaxID=3241165 RepID=UPI00351A94C4
MITTREGREIIAEALRAIATVLDRHDQRAQGRDSGGARRLGEALGQGMHTSDPVTNPAAEMISGALGMAEATTEVVTDATTGMMLEGIGSSDVENEGTESSRGTDKRRSPRKRASSESE